MTGLLMHLYLNSLSIINRATGVLSYSLSTVTANGPEMDEVGDVVMWLADGVWGLVKGGIAGLLRVSVHSKCAYLRVGYAIISGESTWCIKTALDIPDSRDSAVWQVYHPWDT